MPVLIDGNNLLFAACAADPKRPPSRSTLCLHLGQWARRTGAKVAVVFDGPAPSDQLARQMRAAGITISFSGAASADDTLAEAIATDSAARRLLVVSSDRAVARAARRRKARTIRSDAFWAMLQRDLARPVPRRLEPPQKRRGVRPADTEHWLRELGLTDGQPDDGSDER